MRMLVTPRPGVHRENLLKALREVHTAVSNLWSGGSPGPAQQRLAEYLEWVTNMVRKLGNQRAAADLDQSPKAWTGGSWSAAPGPDPAGRRPQTQRPAAPAHAIDDPEPYVLCSEPD